MKKNATAWLQLFLVVIIVGFGSIKSQANEPILTDQISPCDVVGNWNLISQKEGISIYYSTISCNNESFLAIKFENTTDASANLVWSLTHNSESVQITEDEMREARMQIPANTAHIFKGTYMIEVEDENDLSNFQVSIQTLKN